MRLSNSDRRCVDFVRAAADIGTTEYVRLAQLCAAMRAASAAGERECSIDDAGHAAHYAAKARREVENIAGTIGLSVSWPGLWPTFRKLDGTELHLAHIT